MIRLDIPIKIRLWNIVMQGVRSIQQLNIFEKQSLNLLSIRRGRIASRIYVVLLLSALSTLIIYTAVPRRTFTSTVKFPSVAQY